MKKKTDDILLQRFGRHLRKLREEKGLKLRALSILTGIDNSKLSKIEHGKFNVTLLTLVAILRGLEITMQDFWAFDYEGDVKRAVATAAAKTAKKPKT